VTDKNVFWCVCLSTSNGLIVSDGSPLALDRDHGHDVLVHDVTYASSIVKFIPEPVTVLYNEEIKQELKRILIYECRCNEGLEGTTGVLEVIGVTPSLSIDVNL
jgi:hypothetical protein